MTQVVQMPSDQLQQLIDTVCANVKAGVADIGEKLKPKSSFNDCNHCFDGRSNHESVEEFINGIVTYKEIVNMSDEEALKSARLLFYGFAAIWWQGIHKEAKTWNDVLILVREHFAPQKPAHQIYKEIFKMKQDDNMAIDTFVCKQRALLAQLPKGRHDEATEIDLIYELLNINYRRHIARTDIKTFRELLERGRAIERNMGPMEIKSCSYCHFQYHTIEECPKRGTED